jgi:DNA processing protein
VTIIVRITIKDRNYPDQLRKIKNPPQQLYLKGNIELLNKNIISIIGSRNCTENGGKLAEKFASELSDQGIVIASGMAKGIDAMAHEATLKAEGKTIAVLGSGLHHIFPKENRRLYNEILEKNGLIISEYPPETKPASNLFLERNRIVSGISIGILVIEATYRSGTSVTAKFAKEQDKKIFVLPHEINESHGVGTNQLIRKGAILVTSTKEVIEEFAFLDYKAIKKTEEEIDKKIVKEEYKEIYELIANGVNTINKIHRKSNKPMSEVNKILFMLEVEKYIAKTKEGYICV